MYYNKQILATVADLNLQKALNHDVKVNYYDPVYIIL